METDELIDWDRVSALREDIGAEDFDEILALFLAEVEETLTHLSSAQPGAVSASDFHSLKGSALNLGMAGLAALSAAAETDLENGGQPPDLSVFNTVFRQSRATLNASG